MGAVTVGVKAAATTAYFLMLQISYNLNLHQKRFDEEQKKFPSRSQKSSYDFVIAGAGTAGCLLANRLSKNFNVLLLEAGPPAPSLTEVPSMRGDTLIPELNYYYTTVPQKYCSNKVLTIAQGRMMGGSYSHNGLLYNRGNSKDYDTWAKLTRDKTWLYTNVIKTYKTLESYTGPFPSDLRGINGPIAIQTDLPPILSKFKTAAEQLGYYYGDANGWQKEGVGPEDFTISNGRAVTTCSALIDPIVGIRKTLTVHPYADVTQILFANGNIARGVTYTRHGKSFTAYANKEVIISAGAFGSPLLLFKSGIGPTTMLSQAKIKTIADLPVGKNLQDHATLGLSLLVKINAANSYSNRSIDQKKQNYSTRTENPKRSTGTDGPEGFFVSDIAKAAGENGWPDMQMQHVEEVDVDASTRKIRIVLILGRPKSFGSIEFNTGLYLSGERSNTKLAIIDYNLLKEKDDTEIIIQGIKKVIAFYKAVYKPYSVEAAPDDICSSKKPTGSDDYWRCVITYYTATPIHPMGACRMGFGLTDTNSVVDSNFRVLKVEKLRVVDSSVFPKITNSNINAPTILTAEEAAIKILAEYQVPAKNIDQGNGEYKNFNNTTFSS